MPLHYPNQPVFHFHRCINKRACNCFSSSKHCKFRCIYAHYVSIEVWDWSNYSNPVKLPVLIGENAEVVFPYILQGNNLAVFYADLGDAVDLYEIRISYPSHSNIIANCFGRSIPPYASQEGNTVYHKQLVRIH